MKTLRIDGTDYQVEDQVADFCLRTSSRAEVAEQTAAETKANHAQVLGALNADSQEKALANIAGLSAKAESADQAHAELAKLQAAQLSAKRLALLDEATRDGRLTPAKRTELAGENAPAWSRDLSALEGFLSYLPKASAEPKEPAAPAPAALTADDEKVAKQLGLDLAAVAAAKKQ